ncbi:MAG: hypothetical protein D6710_08195, partial [Nitrospirae bacterium]
MGMKNLTTTVLLPVVLFIISLSVCVLILGVIINNKAVRDYNQSILKDRLYEIKDILYVSSSRDEAIKKLLSYLKRKGSVFSIKEGDRIIGQSTLFPASISSDEEGLLWAKLKGKDYAGVKHHSERFNLTTWVFDEYRSPFVLEERLNTILSIYVISVV